MRSISRSELRFLTKRTGLLTLFPQVLATWNKREGELIAANKLDRIVVSDSNFRNSCTG